MIGYGWISNLKNKICTNDVWDWNEHNPKLVKVGKKYFLNFSYTSKVELTKINVKIVKFAKEHNCDVVVFEYLDKMRVPKGFWGAKKLRFKLRYWRKTAIQNKVEEMAHYVGMRISRVNARNTSALAYDGSGKLERNHKKDLAIFSTGKVYHADLSASYNIAARYFIRAYQKSMSKKSWLSLQAKVPVLTKRTSQTLSSFISLTQALEAPKVF